MVSKAKRSSARDGASRLAVIARGRHIRSMAGVSSERSCQRGAPNTCRHRRRRGWDIDRATTGSRSKARDRRRPGVSPARIAKSLEPSESDAALWDESAGRSTRAGPQPTPSHTSRRQLPYLSIAESGRTVKRPVDISRVGSCGVVASVLGRIRGEIAARCRRGRRLLHQPSSINSQVVPLASRRRSFPGPLGYPPA